MEDKKAILVPNATYHIYNRANGNERLFISDSNYLFFLEKYKYYISPLAETFCYCLMPNHFHFLIRIKNEKEILNLTGFRNLSGLKGFRNPSGLKGFENLSGLTIKAFSNLFNSYSKAFNKQEDRKGSLFMRPFKRKRIFDEEYLKKLVHYIHYNPVEAGLCSKPHEWKYSSCNAILSSASSLILKNEVIHWFGDKENFIYCHKFAPKETGIEKF